MRQEATAGQTSMIGLRWEANQRAEALRLMLRRAKALETLTREENAGELRLSRHRSSATSKRPKKRSNPNWRRRRATWTRSAASWPRHVRNTKRRRRKASGGGPFDEAAATVRHVERAAERAARPVTHRDSPGGSMVLLRRVRVRRRWNPPRRRRLRFKRCWNRCRGCRPTLSFSTERSCAPCTPVATRRGCVQNAPPRSRRCCRA